jgi:hypothetical protein
MKVNFHFDPTRYSTALFIFQCNLHDLCRFPSGNIAGVPAIYMFSLFSDMYLWSADCVEITDYMNKKNVKQNKGKAIPVTGREGP